MHVSITPTLAQGRDIVRHTFGPYVATAGYNRFFRFLGMTQEAQTVKDAFTRGDRSAVAAGMSERLCDAIGVTGDEAHVRARIRAYAERGVDVCVINPIAPTLDTQTAIYERLSDVLAGISFAQRGVLRATA